MNTKFSTITMTFFAWTSIFVGQLGTAQASQVQVTQIVFAGAEAKMGMNLFKFQMKNHRSDLSLSLKFISVEKEVDFDIHGMKAKDIKKRLVRAIKQNNNCEVIKENEVDQINAQAEYHDCLAHAKDPETIKTMNQKQFPSWKVRLVAEGKLSVAREEMVLEVVNPDSDAASIISSLANQVQDELNFRRPNSGKISVLTQYVQQP